MVFKNLSSESQKYLVALSLVMLILFALNVFQLYVGLESLAFWGYPHVSSFFEDSNNPIRMKKSTCPVFIGPDETKQVVVTITNTSTLSEVAYFQTVITSPDSEYDSKYLLEQVSLLPHETRIISFNLNKSNFVRNRYVLSRSFVSWQPVYVSTRSIACHSVVIDFFGLPSDVIGYGTFSLLIAISTLLAVLFLKSDPLFKRNNRPRSSYVFLLSAITLMTIGSLIGSWLISFIMFVLIVLGFCILASGF